MDGTRVAPLAGIAGCVALLAVLGYPYVAVEGPVGPYYGSGAVNPLVAGLLAAVVIIVFAAGREERTDPPLAAGAALVFGAFATLTVLLWALTVRVDVVEISVLHRWAATGVAALVPVAGLWYARSLDLF